MLCSRQIHSALIWRQLLMPQVVRDSNGQKTGSPKFPAATKLPGKTAMFRNRNIADGVASCHVDKLC